MAHLQINGTTFSGLPDGSGNASAWQPTAYDEPRTSIGVTLVAANGTRNRVHRGTNKRVFTIAWDATNAATVGTLETIAALTTTFTLVSPRGTSYTVQNEDDALEVEFARIDQSLTQYWTARLTLYEV